jgi:iron complex outermembrane receptor protein
MLAASCCVAALGAPFAAMAQSTSTSALQPHVSQSAPESIIVRAQRLLVREKNSPSAVTELGAAQIAQTGVSGSVATLLRQAPSVYVYQQGIGNNEPVLSIRGTRGLETAQTLDGVPMQDLLNGGSGGYLQNNVGGYFNLDQISNVSIYPGVAYPDQNTFGTIGGTIAYGSKRPTNDMGLDVFGSVGSFGTYNEGFTANTGRMNGFLGTGDDAPKAVIQYSNLQTQGFIDNTPARYNNVYGAFDKPYQGGLSDFQATILYNTGDGLIQSEPTPVPYLQKNGLFSNYPRSQVFQSQSNDYFTAILKDDTYISDYLTAGVTAFYRYSDSALEGYGAADVFEPPGFANPAAVDGAAPFVQNPAGFGEQGLYQPGPGGYFFDSKNATYNPALAFPAGSKYCPASVAANWASVGLTGPCGTNAQLGLAHNDTYGVQPRFQVIAPEVYGIDNTIKFGGLIAKETQPAGAAYLWGAPNIPQTPANQVGGFSGGTERAIFQVYAQDKIDLFENTLHITPGITWEGSYSETNGNDVFGGTPSASYLASAYCQAGNPCFYGHYKAYKWDKAYLPFANVSYDFDKIMPTLKGLSVYGSFGESSLFAPVSDFSPNLIGHPPYASIVHMYEGGIKYNTPKLYVSLDYFYQKVDRDFGFFQFQSGPEQGLSLYDNSGQREFKGVEAAVQYQLTPEVQLFGNASHLLAKYLQTTLASVTVFEDQFGIALRGAPNTGIPDWLANFGVQYDKHNLFREDDAMSVRFAGQYTGHQATTYDVNGLVNIGSLPGVAPFGTYQYYNVTAGATVYDPHGGISPFAIFNLDWNYTLPTPGMSFLKSLKFDLNVDNIFNHFYYQYFYKQISPSNCGTFKSGPFAGNAISNYGCTPEFADALPGEPFAATFTVTAHF